MAGSSTFPTSVDNKTALVDGLDYMEADNVNNAYVPINKTQTFIGANGKGASWSTDMLEYLANTKGPVCTKASASTISVSAGVVLIKNGAQSNRLMRRNTSPVTITASDLDTGAMASGTYYYIYAVADSAATTFTCKFSASASSPTGLTNFELIGWFYNQSGGSLDITLPYVGNVKNNGRDVPNNVTVVGTTDITNTTSLADMTDMAIRFYTSGRPCLIIFDPNCRVNNDTGVLVLDVDGSTVKTTKYTLVSSTYSASAPIHLLTTLSAGTHTIKGRWNATAATVYQDGTSIIRNLTIIEL